jgi:hypothetical protein
MTIESIIPLTTIKWENARMKAEKIVKSRIAEPQRSAYRNVESKWPRQLVISVGGMILMVMFAAFYVSAIREIEIANAVLHDAVATISILAMAEIGALLFGLATRVLESNKRMLRAFQLVCIMIALTANVTVAVSKPIPDALVFDWLITLAAPMLVLGIGLIIEGMLTDWILNRQQTIARFEADYRAYEQMIANISSHPEFNSVWAQTILDELIAASKNNREVITELVEADPEVRANIVYTQWKRHQWSFDPTQTPELMSAKPGNLLEISAKLELSKQEAIEILRSNNSLLSEKGSKLVEIYGGSEATWSRAKAVINGT